jgi:hypothetical protein
MSTTVGPLRGTEGSNPFLSSSESAANSVRTCELCWIKARPPTRLRRSARMCQCQEPGRRCSGRKAAAAYAGLGYFALDHVDVSTDLADFGPRLLPPLLNGLQPVVFPIQVIFSLHITTAFEFTIAGIRIIPFVTVDKRDERKKNPNTA